MPSIVDRQITRFTLRRAMAAAGLFAVLAPIGCQSSNKSGGIWDPGAMFASFKDKSEGEAWTILCLDARDKHHVQNADHLLSALKQVKGLDSSMASVAHEDNASKVYYGRYSRKVDAAGRESFGADAVRDLQLIRSLAAGDAFPFATARYVPVPTPDAGRPEWHVAKCPGVYTLQVGVFYDTPTFSQRKEAAAQWVEQLRSEGVEAYYHHGEVRSSVMVGQFGVEDIIRERNGPANNSLNMRTRYSQKVETLRNQQEFRYNLENGFKIKRTIVTPNGPRGVYQESFLVPVPGKKVGPAPESSAPLKPDAAAPTP